MFISVRKYENVQSPDVIRKRVEEEFIPIISKMPGFIGYYVMDCGNSCLASISMFDTKENGLASNSEAREWVKRRIADLIPQSPQIISGETILTSTSAAKKLVV